MPSPNAKDDKSPFPFIVFWKNGGKFYLLIPPYRIPHFFKKAMAATGGIVAIEMDKAQYPDLYSATEYLKKDDRLKILLSNREFKLKTAQCRWMSFETKRKVWTWHALQWQPKRIRVERPSQNPYVVVIYQEGSESWNEIDLPPILSTTQIKRSKEQQKAIDREFKKKTKAFLAKQKREEKRAKKASPYAAVVPAGNMTKLGKRKNPPSGGKGLMKKEPERPHTPMENGETAGEPLEDEEEERQFKEAVNNLSTTSELTAGGTTLVTL